MDLGNAKKIHEYYEVNPYRPKIKVKKVEPDAKVPIYGSKDAACADLYACIPDGKVIINPHETVLIHTGLAMAPEEGWYIRIYARSGLATKQGLAPANKVGEIDNDYRGELLVALHNHGNIAQTVNHGDRIAQMEVTPYWQADFAEVDELDETERGAGGFGHTGK